MTTNYLTKLARRLGWEVNQEGSIIKFKFYEEGDFLGFLEQGQPALSFSISPDPTKEELDTAIIFLADNNTI